MRKLSSQLEWQSNPQGRPVRLVYTSSGQPTAAILSDDTDLVENLLFWVACKDTDEANYLLAIINSEALYEAVSGLMPKGQFGARHLHKHLWKLPIPRFDPAQELHVTIAEAGATAAAGAGKKLEELREQRGDKLTVIGGGCTRRAGRPTGSATRRAYSRLPASASTAKYPAQLRHADRAHGWSQPLHQRCHQEVGGRGDVNGHNARSGQTPRRC